MPIDYKRYPPNWKTYIVPAVLNRARQQCEECSLGNGSTVYSVRMQVKQDGRYKQRQVWFSSYNDAHREAEHPHNVRKVKVVLTIAHLDHDETNIHVTLDRLRALCQACHLRYDAPEKYRRSLENWATPQPTEE